MITDAQFLEQEAELLAIFERDEEQSRALDEAAPKEHIAKREAEREAAAEARIRRIIEMAQYEVVLKDTTSFLFHTFGAGVDGLAKAVFGALDPAGAGDSPPAPGESNITNKNTAEGATQNQNRKDIPNSEGGNP